MNDGGSAKKFFYLCRILLYSALCSFLMRAGLNKKGSHNLIKSNDLFSQSVDLFIYILLLLVVQKLTYNLSVPCKKNEKLSKIVDLVREDTRLHAFLGCSNVMAIDRMGFTDHGPIHVKIVANSALKLLRILVSNGVDPSVVKNYDMAVEDAEVIVVLASIFHDLGMIIGRKHHEEYSLMFAYEFLKKYLPSIYTEEESVIISSEVLQAMIAHHPDQQVLTLEAGIVRVADALDMAEGRARIPFEAGKIDIHSVSALSIEDVQISEGKEKPILIKIRMSNSAGIFQIDELLKARIQNSGLEKYIHVMAEILGESERRIVEKFEL